MSSGTSGPDALKWVREVSGLTQRGLAARSGVSERTIRGLERGQVRTPHRASLRALADAADLDDLQAATFLRAWAPDRITSLAELDERLATLEDVVAEATLQADLDEHLVASWTRYTYRRGMLAGMETDLVLEAQRDGVDTYVLPYLHEHGERVDLDLTTTGCRLRTRHAFDRAAIQVFELELPQPLSRGESCAFSVEFAMPEPASAFCGETSSTVRMVHRTVPLTVVEVVFEDGPPETVWEIELEQGGRYRRLHEAALSQDGRAHLTRRHAPIGAYGFEWTNDDPDGA